jgi:hypothetical protein|tara:strand:- start:5922 stop:6815 length:894 start_codon:yes stop_codon:yes gene_type:complete
MINAIILSKDKACQLELLLRSIRRNTSNLFDIKVLYEASNAVFNEGYEQLKGETFYHTKRDVNLPVKWYERTKENISEDIIGILNEDRDLTCFFSDEDILFSRPPSYKEIVTLFRDKPVTALSFRLGNNTIIQNPYSQQEYFVDKPTDGEFLFDKFLFWNASDLKPFTNFAIPFSSHGHVHTTKLTKFILEQTEINDLENFEKSLQDNLYAGVFGSAIPPYMACLEYSILITNIAEKVSDPKEFEYGIKDFGMNERYLQDYKIDYDFFNFDGISKPFQQFITRFHREDYMHYSRESG